MLLIEDLLDLKLGDPVRTPDGIGFYQGRWYTHKTITHLIVKHQIDWINPEQSNLSFPPGKDSVVMLYPVEQTEVI